MCPSGKTFQEPSSTFGSSAARYGFASWRGVMYVRNALVTGAISRLTARRLGSSTSGSNRRAIVTLCTTADEVLALAAGGPWGRGAPVGAHAAMTAARRRA